ncbi:MAG: aspartate/glutamate racemase family protein [Hyphomicrobiaceae bacterium]|nr:aspartate/glutamate racemase family protein [Hyphomicrobiaceae bacterium]
MAMRIWHQSFTELARLPAYADAMKAHAAKVLRPDTEVVWHGQLPGTYPSNYPGDDIGYGPLYAMHGLQWMAAARAAEAQGFDAYAMCTLPNPMLREAKGVIDIPVIGLGEATFHMASMLGYRFGVMLFIDRMVPLYREQIATYGLADRCVAVRASGLAFADVLSGFSDPGPTLAKFQDAARSFIRETGADVIIPGEVPMSMLLAMNGISRVDDVPVMDTLACCLKMAELMVDLRRTTGIRHSRAGFFNTASSRARMDEVWSFYGLDKLKF